MTNQIPLNDAAVYAAGETIHKNFGTQRKIDRLACTAIAQQAIAAYFAVDNAQRIVESFINARPNYITAIKNTRGTDNQADYWRWQGGAEARRQLAETLGWTVPYNPGETTRQETFDDH